MIPTVADGPAEAGAVLYFVTATGKDVKPFTLLRADTWDDTGFSAVAVIVAEGTGLYDPNSCFVDRSRADGEAARRKWVRRRLAEADLEAA